MRSRYVYCIWWCAYIYIKLGRIFKTNVFLFNILIISIASKKQQLPFFDLICFPWRKKNAANLQFEYGIHTVASGHLCAQADFEHIVEEYKNANLNLQMIMVILPFKVRAKERKKIIIISSIHSFDLHSQSSLIDAYFSSPSVLDFLSPLYIEFK